LSWTLPKSGPQEANLTISDRFSSPKRREHWRRLDSDSVHHARLDKLPALGSKFTSTTWASNLAARFEAGRMLIRLDNCVLKLLHCLSFHVVSVLVGEAVRCRFSPSRRVTSARPTNLPVKPMTDNKNRAVDIALRGWIGRHASTCMADEPSGQDQRQPARSHPFASRNSRRSRKRG
jgi:hypothetical protein